MSVCSGSPISYIRQATLTSTEKCRRWSFQDHQSGLGFESVSSQFESGMVLRPSRKCLFLPHAALPTHLDRLSSQPKRYRGINLQGTSSGCWLISSMRLRRPGRESWAVNTEERTRSSHRSAGWLSTGCMPCGSSFPFYALLLHTTGPISLDGQEKGTFPTDLYF